MLGKEPVVGNRDRRPGVAIGGQTSTASTLHAEASAALPSCRVSRTVLMLRNARDLASCTYDPACSAGCREQLALGLALGSKPKDAMCLGSAVTEPKRTPALALLHLLAPGILAELYSRFGRPPPPRHQTWSLLPANRAVDRERGRPARTFRPPSATGGSSRSRSRMTHTHYTSRATGSWTQSARRRAQNDPFIIATAARPWMARLCALQTALGASLGSSLASTLPRRAADLADQPTLAR